MQSSRPARTTFSRRTICTKHNVSIIRSVDLSNVQLASAWRAAAAHYLALSTPGFAKPVPTLVGRRTHVEEWEEQFHWERLTRLTHTTYEQLIHHLLSADRELLGNILFYEHSQFAADLPKAADTSER